MTEIQQHKADAPSAQHASSGDNDMRSLQTELQDIMRNFCQKASAYAPYLGVRDFDEDTGLGVGKQNFDESIADIYEQLGCKPDLKPFSHEK